MEKEERVGSFFGASKRELEGFFCGFGTSTIFEKEILVVDYPFEPSVVFPTKRIWSTEIDEIHLDCFPPTLKIGKELVFIERNKLEQLSAFAERNNIALAKRNYNWDWITEPFVDTEFTLEQQRGTFDFLGKRGFTEAEILDLREEIGEQMFKYNFDTMLWEWGGLGLSDVLSAMRVKYGKPAFEAFYWKAMEIEMRGENYSQTT